MMNVCIRLTLDTNDPTEADRIVRAMMEKKHKGVIGWGKYKNNDDCQTRCKQADSD